MTPEDFTKKVRQNQSAVIRYARDQFPVVAERNALRFINGNFRARGYQDSIFKKWDGGATLVKTGALRAATTGTRTAYAAKISNNMPYARTHNEGFKGTVTVKAYSRHRYGKAKVGTGKFTKTGKERKQTRTVKIGQVTVRTHTRKMNIPKRQFMPHGSNGSTVLSNAIIRDATKDIKQLIL